MVTGMKSFVCPVFHCLFARLLRCLFSDYMMATQSISSFLFGRHAVEGSLRNTVSLVTDTHMLDTTTVNRKIVSIDYAHETAKIYQTAMSFLDKLTVDDNYRANKAIALLSSGNL